MITVPQTFCRVDHHYIEEYIPTSLRVRKEVVYQLTFFGLMNWGKGGNLNGMEHGSLGNNEGFTAIPNDISWGAVFILTRY